MSGDSLPAVRQDTNGDDNPDRSMGFLRPHVGWPRRWPPVSAAPAIGCFARNYPKTGLDIQERFPFSPVTFMPDDEGKYTTGF
jgi:hypothetical protein